MASAVSDLFRKITSFKMGKSQLEGSIEESGQLNKSENIFKEFQKILIWNDPFLSCLCIVVVNIVFWLIIYLDLKFYGIIFISLLLILLEQLFTAHFSTNSQSRGFNWNLLRRLRRSSSVAINASDITCCVKKGQEIIKNAYVKAKIFRRSQPGMFCILTCFCFLFLSVIGRSISGIMLLYLLIMLVLTVPGACIHFCPPHIISSISDFIYSSQKDDNSNDDEIEPYLPETNKEDLELLTLAGELQLPLKEDEEEISDILLERISARTNDTTESVSSKLSFYPESSFMPSAENSIDFLDLELPSSGYLEQEGENNDINFQSQHFDEDSSEEEFAKGLNLAQKQKEKPKTEEAKSDSCIVPSTLNPRNMISLGTNLLSAVVKQTVAAAKSDRESSSDTDSFEMISEEDI